MSEIDELYQDIIVDHHKRPRLRGAVSEPHADSTLFNPLCGDQVRVQIRSEGDIVKEIAFDGHGCSISQASASMMTELCKEKPLSEVKELIEIFSRMMRGEASEQELEKLGDAEALQGVRRFGARIKCAMLSWEACDQCLHKINIKKPSACADGSSKSCSCSDQDDPNG